MAKNEKSKDVENDAPQADEASAEVPVFSINLPDKPIDPIVTTNALPNEYHVIEMPVIDKQEVRHRAAYNPMQALQPGHDLVPAHDGLMGGIEEFAIKAEKDGDPSLAADLQTLLAKLGEVSVNIDMIKSKYLGKLNPSLLNLLSSFH